MNRSHTSRFLIAAAVSVVTLAATLAPVSAADTFTKEHLAAARAAIEASHVAENFDKVLLAVAQGTKSQLVRSNPSFSSQIEAATNKVAIELAAQRPALDKDIQQLWASRFTQAELVDVAKFYNTPSGQKWAKEFGPVLGEIVPIVQKYQKSLEEQMFKRVPEELKKQGLPF